MKKYKLSDITHKRAELFAHARTNGVLLQSLRTNGEVLEEYVIISKDEFIGIDDGYDSNNELRIYPEGF